MASRRHRRLPNAASTPRLCSCFAALPPPAMSDERDTDADQASPQVELEQEVIDDLAALKAELDELRAALGATYQQVCARGGGGAG